MNIGFVGLGKLGLPVALAIESKGHKVYGYDTDPAVAESLKQRKARYEEEGLQELLDKTSLTLVSQPTELWFCDIVFVAVQTPHDPLYEGVTPIPDTRRDFDYTHLETALKSLSAAATYWPDRGPLQVAVISTVLPGTFKRLRQITHPKIDLYYNPFFIAMGTAIADFLHPEFVLIGTDHVANPVTKFYLELHGHKVRIIDTTIENAEVIKVTYNTFISLKLAFANTVMELCHKLPNTDCDTVIDALSNGNRRIISPAYLRGGMGDGGACHPRDNIAMSWLAGELGLSHNLFDDIMQARQYQTLWLAEQIINTYEETKLPVVILGEAFKANTNITAGSPARLLTHYLKTWRVPHTVADPYCGKPLTKLEPAIYFIATDHDCWQGIRFPAGSHILDPWRNYSKAAVACTYIPIGIGAEPEDLNCDPQ
jgi:UDPglucose 6-dehydrogenase